MWTSIAFSLTFVIAAANAGGDTRCDATRQMFQDSACCGDGEKAWCSSPSLEDKLEDLQRENVKVLNVLQTSRLKGGLQASLQSKLIRGETTSSRTVNQYGGLANMAAMIKNIKTDTKAAGEHVFVVDMGDFGSGTSINADTRSKAYADFFNHLDYDLVLIGNHDLDFEQTACVDPTNSSITLEPQYCSNVANLRKKMNMPFVAGNINWGPGYDKVDFLWDDAKGTAEYDGLTLCYVATTSNKGKLSQTSPKEGTTFSPPGDYARKVFAAELPEENCELRTVFHHGYMSQSYGPMLVNINGESDKYGSQRLDIVWSDDGSVGGIVTMHDARTGNDLEDLEQTSYAEWSSEFSHLMHEVVGNRAREVSVVLHYPRAIVAGYSIGPNEVDLDMLKTTIEGLAPEGVTYIVERADHTDAGKKEFALRVSARGDKVDHIENLQAMLIEEGLDGRRVMKRDFAAQTLADLRKLAKAMAQSKLDGAGVHSFQANLQASVAASNVTIAMGTFEPYEDFAFASTRASDDLLLGLSAQDLTDNMGDALERWATVNGKYEVEYAGGGVAISNRNPFEIVYKDGATTDARQEDLDISQGNSFGWDRIEYDLVNRRIQKITHNVLPVLGDSSKNQDTFDLSQMVYYKDYGLVQPDATVGAMVTTLFNDYLGIDSLGTFAKTHVPFSGRLDGWSPLNIISVDSYVWYMTEQVMPAHPELGLSSTTPIVSFVNQFSIHTGVPTQFGGELESDKQVVTNLDLVEQGQFANSFAIAEISLANMLGWIFRNVIFPYGSGTCQSRVRDYGNIEPLSGIVLQFDNRRDMWLNKDGTSRRSICSWSDMKDLVVNADDILPVVLNKVWIRMAADGSRLPNDAPLDQWTLIWNARAADAPGKTSADAMMWPSGLPVADRPAAWEAKKLYVPGSNYHVDYLMPTFYGATSLYHDTTISTDYYAKGRLGIPSLFIAATMDGGKSPGYITSIDETSTFEDGTNMLEYIVAAQANCGDVSYDADLKKRFEIAATVKARFEPPIHLREQHVGATSLDPQVEPLTDSSGYAPLYLYMNTPQSTFDSQLLKRVAVDPSFDSSIREASGSFYSNSKFRESLHLIQSPTDVDTQFMALCGFQVSRSGPSTVYSL